MKHLLLSALLLLLSMPLAFAGDAELYDPAPPADSAYVRFINTGTKPINALLGNLTYKQVEGFSPYQVIKEGEYDASVDKTKQSVTLKAGTSYSLVYTKQGKKGRIATVVDAANADPSKAVVYFYNLSDKEASLRAPNFNTDILPGVPAGESRSVEINAVTVDVAMNVENVDVKTFPGIELKRRNGFSFLLTGKNPKYDGVWVMNSLAK